MSCSRGGFLAHRITDGHCQVRTQNGDNQTWNTPSRAHIQNFRTLRQMRRQSQTVQQVPCHKQFRLVVASEVETLIPELQRCR